MERERLRRRLDDDRRLTLIHGPPGGGKTTLLVQWLERRRDDADDRWVDLRDTTDVAQAWASLAAALGEDLAGSVPDPRARAHHLATGLTRPVRLVVDGLDGPDGFADDLVALLERAGHLRLTATCRRTVDAVGAIEAERPKDVMVIGPDELRFTEHERATLMRNLVPEARDPAMSWLQELTGGWPAICRAALLAPSAGVHGSWSEPDGARAAQRYVRDRLYDDLLAVHGPTAVFLSTLDEVTDELAEVVTGSTGRSVLPDVLARDGLLLPAGDGRWRWPAAVRDGLRHELRAREPGVVRDLHTELARWCDAHDRPGQAVDHARWAEAWPLVIDLVRAHFGVLVMTDDRPLRAALEEVPDDLLAEVPAMRDAARLLRDVPLRGGVSPTLSVDVAHDGGAAPEDPDELRDWVHEAMVRIGVLRLAGYARASAARAAELLELHDRADETVRERSFVVYPPVLHIQLAITVLLGADVAGSERAFRDGYAASVELGDELLAFDAATYLALTRALLGDLPATDVWLERAATHEFEPPDSWIAPLIETSGHVAAALAALDRLDRTGAEAAISRANDETSDDELWALITHAHARIGLLWGDRFESLARVDRARAAHPGRDQPGSLAHRILLADRVDLLTALGQVVRAERLLDEEGGDDPSTTVRRARSALLREQHARVLDLVEPLLGDEVPARDRLDASLLAAVSAEARHDEAMARRAVSGAARLAADTGMRAPFVLVPGGARRRLPALADDVVDPWGSALDVVDDEVFPAAPPGIELTERERRVLAQLATGAPLAEVASRLHVSPNTVKTQVRSLYRKLGVSTRDAATSVAFDLGLVAPPTAIHSRQQDP